jgi:phosphatidylserine decarboxylase
LDNLKPNNKGHIDSELFIMTATQVRERSKIANEFIGDPVCAQLVDGYFSTIYLSPKDYHRIHMPLTGQLQRMIHVPGRLFSVAPYTARQVPRLFARNERVITIFKTDVGPLVMVLVGAMLVSSTETGMGR